MAEAGEKSEESAAGHRELGEGSWRADGDGGDLEEKKAMLRAPAAAPAQHGHKPRG